MEDPIVRAYIPMTELGPRNKLTIWLRQPNIVAAFQKIWGTSDLIASFDGINISLPINEQYGRTDIKPTGEWPRTLCTSVHLTQAS